MWTEDTDRRKDTEGNEKQRKTKIVFNLLKISLPFEILRILVFHMTRPCERSTYTFTFHSTNFLCYLSGKDARVCQLAEVCANLYENNIPQSEYFLEYGL